MSFWTIDHSPKKYCFGVNLSSTGRAKASIYISSVNISQGLQKMKKINKNGHFFQLEDKESKVGTIQIAMAQIPFC